ncbi:MAG: hypothetical protein H8E25_15500 [Planctomycetes bacterium]|nr:hypothetical protein [Planctomycetota bacterium]
MNNPLSLVIMIALGFIGGMLGSTVFSDSADSYDMSIDGAAASVNNEQLQNELTALQQANDSLRQQFEMQSRDIGMLKERLDRMPAPGDDRGPAGAAFAEMPNGQAFEGQINAIIEQREAQQDFEREQQRDERQAEALTRRVDRLAEELGLTALQAEQYSEISKGTSEKRSQLFSDLREGLIEREEIRNEMQTLRDDEYSQLEGVFTPEQLTQYQESNDSSRGGFGGGGSNRGGGNSTRGGGGGRGNDF